MLKMKITMYELLGMVKDVKAPKKIKYHNEILYFDDKTQNYYDNKCRNSLFWEVNHILNEEVEILDEEKKIPEKLSILQFSDLIDMPKEELIEIIKEQRFKINEIIDYLKSKGE